MKRRPLLPLLALTFGGFCSFGAWGRTAYESLWKAVVRDDFVAVRKLLEQGIDPNTVDPQGRPILVRALQQDSLRVVREVMHVPGVEINAQSPQGETPLMLAAIKGHIDLVRVLIFMNARINQPGWTPLHYAASAAADDSVEIAALLLEHEAVVDAPSPNHSTPLMLAAQYGSEGMVRLLLRAGANVHARNQLGLDVVDFARRSDRAYMVRLLQAAQTKSIP